MKLKTKKPKNNQNRRKNFFNERNSFILAVVLVALIVLIYAVQVSVPYFENSKSEKQEAYHEWLVGNCDCLEKEKIVCMEGFEYDEERNFCVAEGKYTNVRKSCSQFNCSEEIVSWNSENKLWSPVLDFEDE